MMLDLLEETFWDRRIVITLILSLLLHGAIFYFQSSKKKYETLTRIDNVEFIDETSTPSPTPTPPTRSVFQAIKDKFTGRKRDIERPNEEEVAKIVKSLPPVPGVDQAKGIELSDERLDRSQAKGIDLDKFDEMEGPKGGASEVIKVASEGEQASTEDIVSKAPIKISEKKEPPPDASVGLYSSPGSGGGLDLERVPEEEIRSSREQVEMEGEEETRVKTVPSQPEARITITGPLSERAIKYKPLPSYPDWAAERGLTAVISLRIQVNPDGSVQRGIFVLRTSGYGSWDRMVINTIKKWRFASLSSNEPQVVQNGVLTIKFILE